METIFTILLLGCSHDLAQCDNFTNPTQQYASVEECETVLPMAMHEMERHPVGIAECVPLSPDEASSNVEIGWKFKTGGQLLTIVLPPHETATQLAHNDATRAMR